MRESGVDPGGVATPWRGVLQFGILHDEIHCMTTSRGRSAPWGGSEQDGTWLAPLHAL